MTIRIERQGAVVHLVIDRPEKRNAMSPEMYEALGDATLELQKDDTVRAVVLRAVGKNFCSGSDVGNMTGFNVVVARKRLHRAHRVITGLANLDKPVIAAVRGPTVGFGWSMAMACDLLLASDNASFGQVFKKVGLAPDGAAAYFLTNAIGAPRARELMMSARMVDAAKALQLGLINEIVADAQLEERATALANELAESATFALAMGKRLFRAAAMPNLEAFLDLEAHVQNAALQSDDHKEGAAAFREKRKPNFVGH